MKKKVLILVLAAVMLISCTCTSCGGSAFEKSKFFDADFTTGSYNDTVNKDLQRSCNGEVTFVDDADVGSKVAEFKNACITYLVDTAQMAADFTMEAYVNVKKQGGFGVIAGTYFFNSKVGAAFVAGKFDGAVVGQNDVAGANKVLSLAQGNNSDTATVPGGEFNTWVHLVYVHQGEKAHYYVDGVEVTEAGGMAAPTSIMTDPTVGFRIGAYNSLVQFPVEEFRAAFVRLYNTAATQEDVTALFNARNGGK